MIMVPCKLVKLGRVASPYMNTELRSNSVDGLCRGDPPAVGKTFNMIAPPLSPDAVIRIINTSVIQKVTQLGPNKWSLETLNSLYEVEILGAIN